MERKSGAIALALVLAGASAGCVSIGRPWPSAEPLARAGDTRWPTVSVELCRVHERGEVRTLEPGDVTRERVLWVLGASDLFRAVESAPSVAEWNARIELELRSDFWTASFELTDATGAILYQGTNQAESSYGDPVPGLVQDLLAEARARGIFEARAP